MKVSQQGIVLSPI